MPRSNRSRSSRLNDKSTTRRFGIDAEADLETSGESDRQIYSSSHVDNNQVDSHDRNEPHNDEDEIEGEDEEIRDESLYELCVIASESESGEDSIWDDIREWCRNTSPEDRAVAIAEREKNSKRTPLHEACNHSDPPLDIIQSLLSFANPQNQMRNNANQPSYVSPAQYVDKDYWTPLHIACSSGVPAPVVQLLVDAYPEAITKQDERGRTPLHFLVSKQSPSNEDSRQRYFSSFLKRNESPAILNMIKVAQILTSTTPSHNNASLHTGDNNANGFINNNNTATSDTRSQGPSFNASNVEDSIHKMLPLHYACVYGIPAPVVKVLVEAFPESIIAQDNKGRTPVHYIMSNAAAFDSPQNMQLLLEREMPHNHNHHHHHSSSNNNRYNQSKRNIARVVNIQDQDGSLPLQLLVNHASREENSDTRRENITKCLNIYLDAKPRATAKFLTGLQSLPDWLRDKAVVNANVKIILNEKIAKRFPTMILMLDGYFLIAIVILFAMTGHSFIQYYDEEKHMNDAHKCSRMIEASERDAFSYFLYTGAAYFSGRELLQMLSLYSLGTFKSWVTDVSNWTDVIVITLVYFFTFAMESCMLTKDGFRVGIVITIMILAIKIISFLKSTLVEFAVFVNGVLYVVRRLGAFLVALFVILIAFSQIFFFIFHLSERCNEDIANDVFPVFAHCTQPRSLLRVCASLMGEVNPSDYTSKPEATLFFILYVFLVIILLSNVLIAVVTDNYGVIKNERAAMVFWSNRLDFVAEMDAISRVQFLFSCLKPNSNPTSSDDYNAKEKSEEDYLDFVIWQNFMSLFFEKHDMKIYTFEYWVIAFYRMLAFFVITPLWIALGFLSAGWLWPPQVRQKMLVQRVVSNTRADVSNVISMQISELRKEVYKLRVEVKAEMKSDRQEIIAMKAEAEAVQSDVLADMMQIKEIMSTLLELRRSEIANMQGRQNFPH